MPFPELILHDAPPKPPALASRADVAVFAGLVARRPGVAVPEALRQTLADAGWAGTGPFARPPASVDALLDVPVPLESWDAFDHSSPGTSGPFPAPGPTSCLVHSVWRCAVSSRRAN